jgi:hypothetical protein
MDDNIKYTDDLIIGVDYELSPEGFRILSEMYLKNRGYCCGNGCKNCPYHPKAMKGNTNIR